MTTTVQVPTAGRRPRPWADLVDLLQSVAGLPAGGICWGSRAGVAVATGGPRPCGYGPARRFDGSAVHAWASTLPQDILGVWCAARGSGCGLLWLVEVCEISDADAVAAGLAALLPAGCEVVAYRIGDVLPARYRAVRLHGRLVCANPFLVGPLPPRFAHPPTLADAQRTARVDVGDRQPLVDYLGAGELLQFRSRDEQDILDAAHARVVPTNLRTDGHWVWSDAVTHYLREHGVPPEPAFHQHLRGRAGTVPTPSGVRVQQALAAIALIGDRVARRPGR